MDLTQRIRLALTRGDRRPDDDVVEELAQHARAMYQAARAEGTTAADAERAVGLQIAVWADDATLLKRPNERPVSDHTLPATGGSSRWTAGMAHDLRYALRLFYRQRAFALLVVAIMALGIGATTTLFSVTYGVLMQPLPWPAADRLVLLEETRAGNRPRFGAFSNAAYLAWRDRADTIEALAAWAPRTVTLAGAGDAERVRIAAATASLFPLLGVRPLLGVVFTEDDERESDVRVVVLSEALWRQRFAGSPDALDRVLELDGQPHRVVGVLPDGAAFPDRDTRAWVPFRVPPATGNQLSLFNAVARLGPGVTPRQAADEATARGRFAPDTGMTTMAIFGGTGPIEVAVRPLQDALTAHVRRPLLVLLAAVFLLLLAATANVASLQLARATARRRELAIRAALGAGTVRVMRQLLTESAVLGICGGIGGLLVSFLLHRSLPSLLPADFPRAAEVGLRPVVVLFALAVAMATSVIFGLLPARRIRRINLTGSLTEDAGAPVGTGTRSGLARLRLAIMVGQVAIACVLLIGASLLARSVVAMVRADRGYDPAGLLTARLSLPASAYPAERRHALLVQILDRLANAPGVSAAAFTSELPLTPGGSTSAFTMPSRAADGAPVSVQASPRIVSPGAFRALNLRIVEGRAFTEQDTETSQPVVIVNRTFARRHLGDRAIGARLPMGVGYITDSVEATVVGVADDVRYLTAASQPEIYYSYRQFRQRLPVSVVTLLLRTDGAPASLAGLLRTAVREADDTLVPDAVMSMEDRVLVSVARPRLYAVLLGGFAVCALAIAAVGLFAVLSYTVGQRSRELAVRAALGARRGDLVRMVVAQALGVAGAGIIAGVAGSALASRAIGALLYGITPYDLPTYAGVPAMLIVIALLACIAPARRAAGLDPWRLLRAG